MFDFDFQAEPTDGPRRPARGRTYRLLLSVVLVFTPWMLSARQPAQVRLYCISLRFQTATTKLAGQTYTLEITSDSSYSEINGELAPLFDNNLPTHGAFFRMQSPNALDPVTGQIAFDEAQPSDNNGNGFEDFFEVSQPVSATTHGLYATAVDKGTVVATWSRAAGSSVGTCRLRLSSSNFGQLPEFSHTFELLEYTGTLAYTPGTNNITGTLSLAQTGPAANTLSGAVTLTRVTTNRFDAVRLLTGSLVNSSGDGLTYGVVDLGRDTTTKTNYFGYLEYADGDLTTSTEDYYDWVLSIDDPNDSNSNGIPDLTDDLTSARRSPQLRLTRAPPQLLLSISGEVGTTWNVEEVISLNAMNWTRSLSITLTNDPQVVVLPSPDTPTRFWRIRGP